jgi:PhnB protein
MTQLNAYINFPGNTREAMAFYKECLGGELELSTVAGSPIENDVPEEVRGGILHSTLTTEGFTLMASDMRPAGQLPKEGPISLMINCNSDEEASRVFAKLSEGGSVFCPLGPSFWGATFGGLMDKFGINWLVHYARVPAEQRELAGV